ncbi:MAG: hypothetical protein AAF869_12090, partial [Pseudomonadota bacterium]
MSYSSPKKWALVLGISILSGCNEQEVITPIEADVDAGDQMISGSPPQPCDLEFVEITIADETFRFRRDEVHGIGLAQPGPKTTRRFQDECEPHYKTTYAGLNSLKFQYISEKLKDSRAKYPPNVFGNNETYVRPIPQGIKIQSFGDGVPGDRASLRLMPLALERLRLGDHEPLQHGLYEIRLARDRDPEGALYIIAPENGYKIPTGERFRVSCRAAILSYENESDATSRRDPWLGHNCQVEYPISDQVKIRYLFYAG